MQAGFHNGDTRLWSRFNALLSFAVINVQFSGFLWAKNTDYRITHCGQHEEISSVQLFKKCFVYANKDGLHSTIVLGFQVSMTH